VGGGTKGGLWTQIVSSVVGRPQLLPAQVIGASYGDALLAGIAAGIVEPSTRWNEQAVTIEPDAAARDTYDKLYPLYGELYPSTREINHGLADMQTGNV
jgi:xylulokinase